jgi:hypothetical protein
MYVFPIDIPFKDSKSVFNMRSKVTKSYLHIGVFDRCAMCMSHVTVLWIFTKDIRQSLLHIGVNDTTVMCTAMSLTPL